MSRPFSRHQPQQPLHRVNGKIRAREVRVIGQDGEQAGVMDLPSALNLARAQGIDLVEIARSTELLDGYAFLIWFVMLQRLFPLFSVFYPTKPILIL